jgi:hypothetical protein
MKQTYALLLFSLLCSFVASAQIKKGDIVLGGNIDYSNQAMTSAQSGIPSTTNSTKSNAISINPSLGKAIRDNLVVGIDLAYSRDTYSYNTVGGPAENQVTSGFMAGIFVRRYKPIGAGFSLFGQAELSGNYTHTNNADPSSTVIVDHTNGYGFSLQFYPGIAYALNRRWQLEMGLTDFFSLAYTHSKETQEYSNQPTVNSSGHIFAFTSSLTGADEFTVGVRYFIGG